MEGLCPISTGYQPGSLVERYTDGCNVTRGGELSLVLHQDRCVTLHRVGVTLREGLWYVAREVGVTLHSHRCNVTRKCNPKATLLYHSWCAFIVHQDDYI